jgi:AcrR family transcriptional regulator
VRRAELLDATDRMIRGARPDASMTAIAAEAGVTKPILYRHFGGKDGLYAALAERYTTPLLAAVRAAMGGSTDPGGGVRATIDAYLAFIEDDPQVYRFLMQYAGRAEPGDRSAVPATIRRLGEEVGAVLREQRGISVATAEALGHGIVGMVHVAGDWWLADGRMSRAQLADRLARLLLGGLAGLDAAARSDRSTP